MFFEFSLYKFATLCIILLALAVAVSASVLVFEGRTTDTERGVREFLKRERFQIVYALRYKLPVESRLALARVGLLSATAPATLAAAGSAKSVPVLVYHGEGDDPKFTTPVSAFVDQMHTLKDAGWQTITLEQFRAFMEDGATLPDRSFLLTFDDGRADAFYSADPVLKDLGYTAVMYVITGFSIPEESDVPLNKFYLSKSELAYMANSGRWELHSHGDQDHRLYDVPASSGATTSSVFMPNEHFLSNKFWLPQHGRVETTDEFKARITADFARSKVILEENFHRPVTTFAYPFNDFGEHSVNFPGAVQVVRDAVRSVYRYAFYQTGGGDGDSFVYPDQNAYHIKRIEPPHKWNGADLLAALEGGRAKSLPYTAEAFGPDWKTDWGVLGTGGTTLSLAAATKTSGASAFLDGDELWGNYHFSLSADVTQGTLSLVARHLKNSSPYVVCAFSGDRIYLEQHSGMTQKTLASAPFHPPALPATYSVSMSVEGTTASCSAYGVEVRATVPNISPRGGVGASIWHPILGTAAAKVTQMSVAPL